MVEYALLLSLVALALVGTIGGMAGQVGGRFNAISNTLASGGNGGLGGGGTVTPPPTTTSPISPNSPTNPQPEEKQLTGTATISVSNNTSTVYVSGSNATNSSLRYQWYKNGNVETGKTSKTININSVSSGDDDYYCVVTAVGMKGSITTKNMCHTASKTEAEYCNNLVSCAYSHRDYSGTHKDKPYVFIGTCSRCGWVNTYYYKDPNAGEPISRPCTNIIGYSTSYSWKSELNIYI